MKRRWWLLMLLFPGLAAGGVSLFVWIQSESPAPAATAVSVEKPEALLQTYCASCHNSGRSKIDLDGPVDHRSLRSERASWDKVIEKLRDGKMPPRQAPQMSAAEREVLIHWLENQLASLEPMDAMQFRVRRLRQSEYRNTVADLVGVAWQPPDDFPADESGWDLARDLPLVAAPLLGKYEAAADRILAAVELPSALDANPDLARDFVLARARQAYRRPLTIEENASLAAVLDSTAGGASLGHRVKTALKTVLTSPHFVYRIEPRPDRDPGILPELTSEVALASRLSYFVWNSAPDEELLALAECGLLKQNLVEQTRRLLKDPRARALADDFAAGWLGLPALKTVPQLKADLAQLLRRETERFVEHIVTEDRSVLEFLDAEYSFLNGPLAKHYGIAGIDGDELRRVSLAGTPRGGLLTQGSVLALTSYRDTSPVQRGKWIMLNLLGTPVPPPPPDVLEAIALSPTNFPQANAKKLLELHRTQDSCAKCHAGMDGYGVPLENFDELGRWRTETSKLPIDATAVMPDGHVIDGPAQLKRYLLGKQGQFVRCLAAKLLGHALGRKLTPGDDPALDPIAARVAGGQFRFSSVVLEVVQSEPFQRAWGDPAD
jgi:mono/diheme cytochrome c family protein